MGNNIEYDMKLYQVKITIFKCTKVRVKLLKLNRSHKVMLVQTTCMWRNKTTLSYKRSRKWFSNQDGQKISPRHLMSFMTKKIKYRSGVLSREYNQIINVKRSTTWSYQSIRSNMEMNAYRIIVSSNVYNTEML